MAQLRELRVDAGERLDGPAALAALPVADLALGSPAPLPALAPHVAGATRLELSSYSATSLHGMEPPASQALGGLPALRRLVLGGREQLRRRNDAAGAAAVRNMESRHAAAVAALEALLPEGCEVQAEPPLVHLW